MSNQTAQYRLFTKGSDTLTNTQSILTNLDALNREIAVGNNNNVSNYRIEPVYVNNNGTNEQRYFIKAKMYDFEYVGYIIYSPTTAADSLKGKYVTNDNFGPIFHGQLYNDMGGYITGISLDTTNKKLLLRVPYEVNLAVAISKTYTNVFEYIPETNKFSEYTGDQKTLSNISPQITFARGNQLYACSISGSKDTNNNTVYKLVPIEDLPQPTQTNQQTNP